MNLIRHCIQIFVRNKTEKSCRNRVNEFPEKGPSELPIKDKKGDLCAAYPVSSRNLFPAFTEHPTL